MAKKRAVHDLGGLAVLRDGQWLAGGGTPTGSTVFKRLESILARCTWLRKTGKPMSERSRTDYGNHIFRSYRDLKELGYAIGKPWNIEQRHIEVLCTFWSEKGLSVGLVHNRLSALSWLGAVMGRAGMIKGTHDYDASFGERKMIRRQATEQDKSPEGKGFDRDEVVRLAMVEDVTFGHMVLLQYALGLRDKEVIRARPLKDRSKCRTRWELPAASGGAKGG